MDKKSLIAMFLIAIILILLPTYQEYVLGVKPQENGAADSVVTERKIEPAPQSKTVVQEKTESTDELIIPNENVEGDSLEKNIVIESENYIVELSNKGGGSIISYVLKKYSKYDSSLVNMVSRELENNLTLSFQESGGSYIETKDFVYNVSSTLSNKNLSDNEEFSLVYTMQYNGTEIRKEFIFYNDAYHIDLKVSISDMAILLNNQYQINWINGLPSTESYVADDSEYSTAFVFMADDLESFEVDEPGNTKATFSGKADWIAVRTKYFITSISVLDANVSNGVYFNGVGIEQEEYLQKLFNTGFFAQYNPNKGSDIYRLYIGPLDHNELGKYDNNLDELIMNNGAYEQFFRPVSRIVLVALEFLHSFIPNWGIVIIVFSILIKILLWPLTKKSYQSTKKMQVLQPKMNAIKEKYKNDQQRMNKEMMELYKVHGYPLSGCLPMLLQMPLLLALYIVFRSTIQLRGAVFIPGWIEDLSRADTLFSLPFSLPMYGDQFNLLPLLMAVTMFFQSKMTMQDPKQKAMVYVMPIFMLAIFNRFPSGLNLYYTLFNLFTIIQQKFVHADDSGGKKKVEKKKLNKRK
ncbi:MAG: membrane protein insertase YidC [Calditrichaeota bacterium]|nr:MAG: membrane protein insertase YidC [Calditrichota bacterium]MBL1205458.1 membrane protein insertase YidC [Calditrichota bacterium]NOG45287.1 membrane protein insertase YidC [Calditrichota bacterium]